MSENEDVAIPEELVYLGQRISGNNKKVYAWKSLKSGEVSLYKKTLLSASVGSVCLIHHGNDNSYYVRGVYAPKYVRRYEKQSEIVEWAAKDEAARQYFLQQSLNTKASKYEPLETLLGDVQRAARNLNRAERRALLSKLAEAIYS